MVMEQSVVDSDDSSDDEPPAKAKAKAKAKPAADSDLGRCPLSLYGKSWELNLLKHETNLR